MKKWMVFCLTIVLLAAPVIAHAQQEELTLRAVEIDLMPEYDQPDVLVMYHIFLAPEVSLPADLELRIPAVVGNPYNVAMRGDDGRLYNLPYEQSQDGEWITVQFATPSNEVRFEYYDPNLTKNGPERAYAYQWPGDYAVEDLSILVQEPVDATDLQITPDLGEGTPGQANLMQYSASLGALQAGETFDVRLSYQKSSDRLTSSTLKVQTSGPISEETPGRMTINDVVPWAVAVIAIGLLSGSGYWYWRSTKTQEPSARRRHRSAREAESDAEEETPGQVYCHRCGKRAAPGDAFCRACGTKLRS